MFRLNRFGDPGADSSGKTALKITRILNSYEKEDPNTTNQCALPVIIFKYMKLNCASKKNKHLGLLAGGALFFGMRSCEYLKTHNAANKQTKLLCIRNFQFMKKNIKMNISSHNLPRADFVAITFESQKNGSKQQTIVQHRTDKFLCPVNHWGNLIILILSYRGTDTNTPINFFRNENGSPQYISAEDMIRLLRLTCSSVGEDKLGIDIKRVGTHSIRTSFSMQLHLSGVKDIIIMTMGRWKSLSFLKYIRPQIQEFSSNLSTLMLSGSSLHFNVAHTRKNLVQTQVTQNNNQTGYPHEDHTPQHTTSMAITSGGPLV